MRIEGSSLIRYLCTALEEKMEDGRIPRDAIERSLKTALSFSPEGWSAGSEEGRSILDPSSVISRLFSVEVEKKMRRALEAEGISKELPWVLRILDENGGWGAGEFLRYFGDEHLHGMSNWPPLRTEYLQALQHFPILFEDSPNENRNERIIDRMRNASSILEGSNLLHISHPKFHKEWSDLVGREMEETPAGVMAKQHWSSVISHEIEDAVRGSQIGVVLQAVGGHVLVAVKESISTTSVKDALKKVQVEWHLHVNAELKDEYGNKSKEELKEMCSEKSLKTTGNKSALIGRLIGRGWSPSLWGSWAGGACGVPLLNDGMKEDDVVSKLAEDYEKNSDTRERSRLRWATFAYDTNDRKTDDSEMVMYLDVMGLGERCWAKGYSTYYCPECGKQAEEWGFEQVDGELLFNPYNDQYASESEWEEVIGFEGELEGLTGSDRRDFEEFNRPRADWLDVDDVEIGQLELVTVFFKYRSNSPEGIAWYRIPIALIKYDEEEFYEEWDTEDSRDWGIDPYEEYSEHLEGENSAILENGLGKFIRDSIGYDKIIENTPMDEFGIPEDTPIDALNLRCANPKCPVTLPSSEADVGGERIHFVPSRTRKQTIEGFSKSREMTAMIESTFGMVMAVMTPASILSMGGDEMIARVSRNSFYDIVDSVESHSLKFHTDVLKSEEAPKLLWWTMVCKENELADLTKTGFKDTLRGYCTDWGSRFVNPMWPDFNV